MNKKQKMIIVSNNLTIGGIQKALVNLLNEIKDKYDVTLFIFSYSGKYLSDIPSEVKIIRANPYLKLLAISQYESKREGIFLYLLRAILVLWTRFINNNLPIKLLISSEKKLDGYDIAISYVQSPHDKSFYGGCNEFVLNKIDAPQKIAYIHCDYLNYGGNTAKNKSMYLKFDCLITVSEGCKKNFLMAIPELSHKTYSVENCNDYADIMSKSNISPIEYNIDNFNIVTVARLSQEKGVIRTIRVIHELLKKGYKICWHIIGDGSQRSEIEKHIAYYKLEEIITLYGDQENPYKYMKNADLFLLPSYHEAAPMVFNEAKCIGLPILSTNTTSAIEMVENYNAGWVCENSITGISEKLEYILRNKSELLQIREDLKNKKFNNEFSLRQFYSVIDGE